MMMQLLGLQTSNSCTASWLSASLDDALRRLFHLSSLITKSSTRDKFARAEVTCRLQAFEPFDIRHVHEKFVCSGGRVDTVLMERLGKANTRRRQFIAYSRKHADELGHFAQVEDISLDPDLTEKSQHTSSEVRSNGHFPNKSEKSKKSEAPTKASTIGPVNINAFDYGLDDARSCTTVATSIVDGKAFSGLKVPELTQYAKRGEHFRCVLCQANQCFNGQSAWR
jgi:hypothetical protein